MKDSTKWLEEPVSNELKDKVFAKVQAELDYNKQHQGHTAANPPAPSSVFNWWPVAGLMTLAIVAIFGLRSMNIIEADAPATTFSQLATLTPEEFEVIENLEMIDSLENIDLDEIRKEMHQSKKG